MNSKVLKMPAAYFVALAIEVEDNEKEKRRQTRLSKRN